MASTRATLRSRVYTMLGRASEATAGTYDTIINEALNDAQKRMAILHKWRTLEVYDTGTLTATVKSFQLSATVMTMSSVTIQDGTESCQLAEVLASYLDEVRPRPESDSTNRPVCFLRHDHWLELVPVPNSGYTIKVRYWKWPTAMDTDVATTEFGDYEESLKAATASGVATILGDDEGAKRWEKRFQLLVAEAIARDRENPELFMVARPFSTIAVLPPGWWKIPPM